MSLDTRGLLVTFAFHILLLSCFLLMHLSIPLPLPAEQGMLINFGYDASAYGPEEPQYNEEIGKTVNQQPTASEVGQNEEKVLTQDFEEAPVLKPSEQKKEKAAEKKKIETIPVKTETKATSEPPKVDIPVVNKSALYSGKKQNTKYTGSEGVGHGEGNQGDPNGDENSTDRSLGFGSGGGISANLNGRSPVALPEPDFDHQKEGKVVVEIKVDRSGKVIEANPGVKGSTTLDNYLLQMAKKAALSSRFDNNPDAPFYQTGTIVYFFKLK